MGRLAGRGRNLKFALLVGAGLLACVAAPAAAAEPAAAVVHVAVPPQGLGPALNQLALQTGRQFVVDGQLTRGLTTRGVEGAYTPEAALDAVLRGTGLTARQVGGGVVIVKRPGAEALLKRTEFVQPAVAAQVGAGLAADAQPGATGAAPAPEAAVEEVVVTGSRIARSGYSQPTPVNVLTAETVEKSGFSNIGDVLSRAPQVGVGLGSANSYFNGDAGASFINLRGLGANRTLVLVNGRRRVPGTEFSSAVDLTSIPANMVERIEVITGGAAAVYGADAVTGVVNVTLKEHVDGVQFSGRAGISGRGDAETYSVGVLLGSPVQGDRGDITVGVSYNKEEPLWARDRSFGRNQVDLFGNPLNRGPNDGVFDSIAVANYRYPGTSYGGAFTIGGTRYTYDGSVRPTQNQSLPGAPANYFVGIGGDGFNDADFAPLRNESQVVAALAHFNYELVDGVKFFTDFQFSNSKTTAGLQPTFDFDLVVKRNNPFLPADVAALMDANGLSQITVGRTNVDQGVSRRLLDRDTWTVVSGLEGDLTERLQWMGFFQYGQYKADITRTNDRINSRFFEALDVVAGPAGPMCASATARAAGCQPLNILGPRAASPGAVGYFRYDQHRQVENTQEVAGLQLTGKLFDLPAGPLSIAAGVEYRKETLQTREDGLASTGQLFNTTGASVKADYNVKEVFGEVLVPILADQPWAKSLSLEGAVRYSDYNTVGSTTAWKVGGQWAPVEDVRFRVTRSKSVRAPSLSELFSPGSFSGAFILDPCDATRTNLTPTRAANCRALGVPANFTDPRGGETKDILTGGNARLTPETSNSWTVGAVVTPRMLPRLSVSIDWWKIDLTDAINLVPFQTIVNGCVDAASIANPYCGLITRRADRAIGVVDVTNINIGKLAAEGVDFQANYSVDLPLNYFGETNQLRFALVGAYMSKNEALVDANDPTTRDVSVGEVDNPRWKVNVTPSFVAGPLELDWTVRYISSTKVDAMATAEGRSDNKVDSRVYNDLFASYALNEGTRIYAGVNNLLDEDPPFSAVTFQGTGRGALFDNIGRYFFVGADARF